MKNKKSDLYTGGSVELPCNAVDHVAKYDTSHWEKIHELTADTHVDAIAVDENDVVYVGGGDYEFPGISDFITAPDPNRYGREIVLGKKPIKCCPYCGNSSGETDSRGMCASCGGNLE